MSQKTRLRINGPPPKSLDFISSMLFVVHGEEVRGTEFVKIYDAIERGDKLPVTQVTKHAIAYLHANGNICYDSQQERYIARTREPNRQ